jgi:sigma-B regulation protein RsbU (phosphoserine phosphatase)
MAVTILIADDVATNRMLLRAMLNAEGYNTIEASDGPEALAALLEATTPVVGLIDWEMPKMDGIEVCRQARLRSNAPPMFLLLVTVRNARQDIVLGLQAGASDYVIKPFDRAELLARVKIGVGMVDLQQMLQAKVQELRDALEQVNLLSGFLPICSYCKKIRDDKNYWEQVESYITKHSEAKFSHAICPQCFEAHVKPDLDRLELKHRGSDVEPR